jgi:hypothetical protein
MAIVFYCPECRQQLRVNEDYRGRRMRCPRCSGSVTVPESDARDVPMEAVVQPESRERPRRTERREEDRWDEYDDDEHRDAGLLPGWITVRGGLATVNTGLGIVLVAFLANTVITIISVLTLWRGDSAVRIAGLLALLLAALTALILGLVGQGMCCAAPEESGSKGWAIASFLVALLGASLLILGFVTLLLSSPGPYRSPTAALTMLWTSLFAFEVAHILLMLFLRKVAVFFLNYSLARNLIFYLSFQLAFVVVGVGLDLASGATRMALDRGFLGTPRGAVVLVIGEVVLLLALAIIFIALLSATRTTIPSPRGGRRPPES